MAKRRAKGEGSLFKRKDGTWCGKIPVGYNTNGSIKYRYVYGKTQGEVKEKVESAKSDVRNNTFVEPNRVTTQQWLDNWLNVTMKGNVKDTTWLIYESLIKKHIVPGLGGVRLMNLQTSHIQKLYNEKLKSGRADEKEGGLSPKTIRHMHHIIHGALDQAVKEKLIQTNPANAVRLPKLIKQEMKTLSVEQVKKFLEAVSADRFYNRYYAAYLLELYTGLRRGELLGLRWKDIDIKKKEIKVVQQLVKVGSSLTIRELKTESSQNRKIAIPDEVIQALKDHKKMKMDEFKTLGWDDIESKKALTEGIVFTNELGKLLQPRNFLRNFKGALRKAGIDPIRFHDLRHTFALLSLQAGTDIKTLQNDLGHESIETTLDKYGHVNEAMKREAAAKRSGLLKSIING
jgi:integrase